jgi:hypothetical protein
LLLTSSTLCRTVLCLRCKTRKMTKYQKGSLRTNCFVDRLKLFSFSSVQIPICSLVAYYKVNFTFILALCTNLTGVFTLLLTYICNLVLWSFLSIACYRCRGTEDVTGVFSFAILKNSYMPYPCVLKNCEKRNQIL